MGLKDFGKKLFPDPIEQDDDSYEKDIYDDQDGYEERPQVRTQNDGNSYSSRSSSNVTMASGSSIEMKVVTPSRFDSVTQIADLLLGKKTVLLNLENTNKETAKRLIDFLSGVAYALSGDVQKVADNTYAITPSNVAVSKESIGASQQAQAKEEPADSEMNY